MAPEDLVHHRLVHRVRCEFLEMPGLRVTEPQARRLWGLDAPSCATVLSILLSSRFLCRTPDGAFVRADGGHSWRSGDYAPAPLAERTP